MQGKRVVVTGGAGFLGKYVVKELSSNGFTRVFVPRSKTYDLTTESGVASLFNDVKPELIIHLAATMGGIGAISKRQGEFFYANAVMGIRLMEEARVRGIEKFVQIGSACSYPKFALAPFKEEDIWNGYPEETSAPYGVAKKVLLAQGQAYRQQYGFNCIHLILVNLYGPGDNFDLDSCNVMPALLRKFVEAKTAESPTVTVWGTGKATREFLYVEDAAKGIVRAMLYYDGATPVNLGSGREISISDLAHKIADAVGYKGAILFDKSKPDGQSRRKLDASKAKSAFGWEAETSIDKGLDLTLPWVEAANAR